MPETIPDTFYFWFLTSYVPDAEILPIRSWHIERNDLRKQGFQIPEREIGSRIDEKW